MTGRRVTKVKKDDSFIEINFEELEKGNIFSLQDFSDSGEKLNEVSYNLAVGEVGPFKETDKLAIMCDPCDINGNLLRAS